MPLLIHEFGMATYGTYVLVTSIAGWVALLDFGVGPSLVKMMAEHLARDEHERIGNLALTSLVFYLVVGIVVAGLLTGLAFVSASVFKVSGADAMLLKRMLLVAAVFALWMWPANTSVYVLGGFQRYTVTACVQLGVTLSIIAAYVVVLTRHSGPFTLFVAVSAITMIGSLVNVSVAWRAVRHITTARPQLRMPELRRIFDFSWAIFLIQLSTVVLYQNTDRVVLGVFIGTAAIALYEPVSRFQSLVVQLVAFTNSAVLPMASHLDASQSSERLKQLFLRGTKYTLAFVTPLVIVLIVLARPILDHWVGPVFALQANNARILLAPQLLIVGGVVGDSIITGIGKLPKRIPYAMAITAANLVLSVVLVQRLGILGVVLGTAIPYLIDYPFHIRLLLREIDVPLGRWMREVIAPIYPLLAVPTAICVAGLFTPLAGSLVGLAALGAFAAGACYASILVFGLTDSERLELSGILAGLKARMVRP